MIKLLIVDDEPQICAKLKNVLLSISENYDIDTAFSGEIAIEKINSKDYDIILTDVRMPGLSGIELLEKTQESQIRPEVIIMTGHGDLDIAINSMRLGAINFLKKPISAEYLDMSIKNAFEKKQLKNKLIESEYRLRKQYESIPIPTFTVVQKSDDEIYITNYNHESTVNYPNCNDTILEKQYNKTFIYNEIIYKHLKACFKKRDRISKEERLVIDEKERIFFLQCNFIEPNMVMVHINDITENYNNRKALIESEERFRSIIEKTPIGMCITDENGYFEFVNDAYCSIYKYTKEELIGKHFTIVVPEELQDTMNDLYKNFIKGEEELRGEWSVINKAGEIISIIADAVLIKGADHKKKKVTFVIDITQRKKSEIQLKISQEDLKEANETKNKFFSIIAHDLRGPLSSFKNLSELLIQELDNISKDDLREMVELIYNSSDRLSKLLENLLEWSRLQTNKITINPQIFNLYDCIKETIDVMKDTADKKEIIISTDVDKSLQVYADINSLMTVIRNILSNAIKFTKNAGNIKFEAYKNDNLSVTLKITDSGVGISDENIEKIFSIDKKLSTIGTNQEKGTGLGLVLAKEFIEKNKGTISVESKAGKGTSFILKIPTA